MEQCLTNEGNRIVLYEEIKDHTATCFGTFMLVPPFQHLDSIIKQSTTEQDVLTSTHNSGHCLKKYVLYPCLADSIMGTPRFLNDPWFLDSPLLTIVG